MLFNKWILFHNQKTYSTWSEWRLLSLFSQQYKLEQLITNNNHRITTTTMFQQQELNVRHLKNVFFQSLEWGLSGIDIPEARNARWIRKRFKKEKVWWAGEEVDLLSDGFHSSGGVSGFPSNPITTVKCDLGSWPYAAHHETPWAFHISSGPDTNRGAPPGILSLQPAAAMGVFRTVEGIKFSKRAPIPRRFLYRG